jgi:hypothetical protein
MRALLFVTLGEAAMTDGNHEHGHFHGDFKIPRPFTFTISWMIAFGIGYLNEDVFYVVIPIVGMATIQAVRWAIGPPPMLKLENLPTHMMVATMICGMSYGLGRLVGWILPLSSLTRS